VLFDVVDMLRHFQFMIMFKIPYSYSIWLIQLMSKDLMSVNTASSGHTCLPVYKIYPFSSVCFFSAVILRMMT
jgi:hypothetical protein